MAARMIRLRSVALPARSLGGACRQILVVPAPRANTIERAARPSGTRGRCPSSASDAVSTLEPEPQPASSHQPFDFGSIKPGDVVSGVVRSIGDQGAVVDVGSVRGWLDRKHVSAERVGARLTAAEGAPNALFRVGDTVTALVLKLDGGKGEMVLSTQELEAAPGDMLRDAQAVYANAEAKGEQYRSSAKWLWWFGPNACKEGDMVEGSVRMIKPYGAFIDLEGGLVSALLPQSEFLEVPVARLDAVLQVGDRLRAQVVRLDRDKGLTSLSTKCLDHGAGSMLLNRELSVAQAMEAAQAAGADASAAWEQWQSLHKPKVGDVMEGVVSAITNYGAFVDLGGVIGLLHASAISQLHVSRPNRLFKEGNRVRALIRSMDPQTGRVELSTKELEPAPGDMIRKKKLVFAKAFEMGEAFRKSVAEAALPAEEVEELRRLVGSATEEAE